MYAYFQVDRSESANMTAIFFSKHIIQTLKNSIANVVFNHSCYLFSERTNSVCCISSDTHTILILGHVTGLQ